MIFILTNDWHLPLPISNLKRSLFGNFLKSSWKEEECFFSTIKSRIRFLLLVLCFWLETRWNDTLSSSLCLYWFIVNLEKLNAPQNALVFYSDALFHDIVVATVHFQPYIYIYISFNIQMQSMLIKMFMFEVTIPQWQSMKMKSDRFERNRCITQLCVVYAREHCFNEFGVLCWRVWKMRNICQIQCERMMERKPDSTLTIKSCPVESVIWPIQPQILNAKEWLKCCCVKILVCTLCCAHVKQTANRTKPTCNNFFFVVCLFVCVVPANVGCGKLCIHNAIWAEKSKRNIHCMHLWMCAFCQSVYLCLSSDSNACVALFASFNLFCAKKWHFHGAQCWLFCGSQKILRNSSNKTTVQTKYSQSWH